MIDAKIQSNITSSCYIRSIISKYKIYFFVIFITAFFAAFFETNVTLQIRKILDSVLINNQNSITIAIISFIVFKFSRHFMYFIRRLFDIKYRPLIHITIINNMYKAAMAHSMHWFESHLSGEISSKIISCDSLDKIVGEAFQILINGFLIIVGVIFIFRISPLPSLILLSFLLFYGIVLSFLLKKQMVLQSIFSNSKQKVSGIINDSFANIFGVKIISNISNEIKNYFFPAIGFVKKADTNNRKFDAYFVDAFDTIMITIMSGIQIYVLSLLYQHGTITPGDFTFIIIITLSIHKYIEAIIESFFFNINPALSEFKSSFDFINAPIDLLDIENIKQPEKIFGDIKFENVYFSYKGNNKEVLKNFNLHIKQHERIGVVGLSGAGKTTMIKCLLRYFDINSGNLLIDNYNISEMSQEFLRANISIIPQDITMFHRSVLDNLKIAKHDASLDEIIEACKKAKIHEDIMLMDKQYDSIVGERGVKLSGGQRQRVAIARAILKDAPILILDEATSALDTPTEKLIQKSLDEMFNSIKATTIVIAHRLSTLLNMDRIIVLENGCIVESGNHKKLIALDGKYKKLWDAQVGGFLIE